MTPKAQGQYVTFWQASNVWMCAGQKKYQCHGTDQQPTELGKYRNVGTRKASPMKITEILSEVLSEVLSEPLSSLFLIYFIFTQAKNKYYFKKIKNLINM